MANAKTFSLIRLAYIVSKNSFFFGFTFEMDWNKELAEYDIVKNECWPLPLLVADDIKRLTELPDQLRSPLLSTAAGSGPCLWWVLTSCPTSSSSSTAAQWVKSPSSWNWWEKSECKLSVFFSNAYTCRRVWRFQIWICFYISLTSIR